MKPLPYTWPIGLAFWVAFGWALAAELPFILRNPTATAGEADRGSMRVVSAAGGLAAFLAFFLAGWLREFSITTARMAIYFLGIACIVAGGLLRRHCFRMLGASFTYDVRVTSGQRVIKRGAYRYVRHPSYTAGLLLFTGIGLALGNWLSLAAAIVLPALAYAYRIAVEERALVGTLGPAYVDYMGRTKRLIPFVI